MSEKGFWGGGRGCSPPRSRDGHVQLLSFCQLPPSLTFALWHLWSNCCLVARLGITYGELLQAGLNPVDSVLIRQGSIVSWFYLFTMIPRERLVMIGLAFGRRGLGQSRRPEYSLAAICQARSSPSVPAKQRCDQGSTDSDIQSEQRPAILSWA